MNIEETKLKGVYIIEPKVFNDERGFLVKPFNKKFFEDLGLVNEFKENFYSSSKKDVIRGMHFQNPPMDHVKLIYCPKGKIIDVVLDIRKNSKTYGEFIFTELSEKNHKMMYIPRGCAHGFISMEENSCTIYLQETTRSEEHEDGIRFDSFGMNWKIENPIISKRDSEFKDLKDFNSPFN